jgi:hypothetical protein
MAHDPVAALPLYMAGAYNYTVFVAGEAVGTAALAVHAGPAGAASVVEGVAATYVAGDAGWVAIHAVDDWGNRLTQVGATGLAGLANETIVVFRAHRPSNCRHLRSVCCTYTCTLSRFVSHSRKK